MPAPLRMHFIVNACDGVSIFDRAALGKVTQSHAGPGLVRENEGGLADGNKGGIEQEAAAERKQGRIRKDVDRQPW